MFAMSRVNNCVDLILPQNTSMSRFLWRWVSSQFPLSVCHNLSQVSQFLYLILQFSEISEGYRFQVMYVVTLVKPICVYCSTRLLHVTYVLSCFLDERCGQKFF